VKLQKGSFALPLPSLPPVGPRGEGGRRWHGAVEELGAEEELGSGAGQWRGGVGAGAASPAGEAAGRVGSGSADRRGRSASGSREATNRRGRRAAAVHGVWRVRMVGMGQVLVG
jgi:hypothetical protein